MSKEWKAPDKVTQKMTRDGAVAENLTTGETSSISERPQEENYSAPAGAAAEKVVQHIGAEIERHAAKGAEKKALDAAQPKTHSSRLQFSEAERATPDLQKAIKKSDTAADRLDKARAAIPKQTKITKERVFDEAKGKAKTRLAFEKTDKPPNGKLRHNPLSRPAQELDAAVHGKIYEVEKENVGVESGHRIELVGEKAGGMTTRAVKRGIRSHKLKPYRAAAAAEKKAAKANADFLYQKALHDNPALAHSNPISRFWQKQRIKKQYAKALKTGGKVKKTAEATAKAAKKTAQETKRATFFVVRHWKGCLIVGGIAFIVLLFFGGLSSCSLFGGNSGSGLIASSYLSEDADITGAESAYVAMEAELQDMLDNIESEYPGYDEYRVTADEIEHDPYVLISILSAWHEGVFTLDEAQSTLEMLFDKQYILTVTEEVEVRYERLMPGALSVSAEQAVYRKVCIELLRELFDALPKKDRDLLGKTCGVFGYPEMTLKEIGMYHMMKESAVEKAKSRAVEKLREAYPGSRLQVWRAVHRMMQRPVLPSEDDSELRRNFPQYVRALAEVYGVLNEVLIK